MSKVHVISDLFLDFNEYSTSEEVIPPETDLVIINGNISKHIKRSFLYTETLCNLYPDVQFVVNLGEKERFSSPEKHPRRVSNDSWPKNLHFSQKPMLITLRDGIKVDVLCTYGFPKIYSYIGDWEDTPWHKNIHVKVLYDFFGDNSRYKPMGTSNVEHGMVPAFASQQDINQFHENETKIVRDWELTPSVIKILVTHINPYKDTRYENQKVTPYNIHLERGYWIGSNTRIDNVRYVGATLYSNPGRGIEARSRFFNI
jgi:hypothetical protein